MRLVLMATWLTSIALSTACSPETVGATQVLVVVNSDLALGTQLTSVTATVQTADGSSTVAAPFSFRLAVGMAAAGSYTLPLSFDIAKPESGADSFRVVVAGYGPLGAGGAQVKIIEQAAILSFQEHHTLRATVLLGSVCFQKLCSDASDVGLVCYTASEGAIGAGQCGPVQASPLEPVGPKHELDGVSVLMGIGQDAGIADGGGSPDNGTQPPAQDAGGATTNDAGSSPATNTSSSTTSNGDAGLAAALETAGVHVSSERAQLVLEAACQRAQSCNDPMYTSSCVEDWLASYQQGVDARYDDACLDATLDNLSCAATVATCVDYFGDGCDSFLLVQRTECAPYESGSGSP